MLDDNAALSSVERWAFDVGCSAFSLVNVPQVLPVPCRGDALTRRVRPRHIRARGNALLAQFAHVPVLLVYHVPEFDCVVRFEILALKRLWMKKPITEDQCPLW